MLALNNIAALGLYCFYVLNILLCTALKSVISDLPLYGAYNQKMAAIGLILTAEYERLGRNLSSVYQVSDLHLSKRIRYHQKANISPECSSTVYLSLRARIHV